MTKCADCPSFDKTKCDPLLNIEDLGGLKPCVPTYGPLTIKDLKPGKTMLYCRCGLSKDTPWCDNSHKGTPYKPMKWKVPEFVQNANTNSRGGAKTKYSICHYTAMGHYCKEDHSTKEIICTECGWTPDLTMSIDDLYS